MNTLPNTRWYGGAASLDEIIPCRELLVCIRDLGSCTDGRILCCCDRSNDYLLVKNFMKEKEIVLTERECCTIFYTHANSG